MQALSLEAFKDLMKSDREFTSKITGRNDVVDLDNGTMTIYSENIGKYLEKYMCKNEEDLMDTLWYSYGTFVKIIE